METSSTGTCRPIPRAGLIALDVLGAVLWLGLVVWVTRVARTPAGAAPVRDLLLVMGAIYLLSRLITVLTPWLVPAVLLAVGTSTAVWSIGGVFTGAGGSLLGYANAAAAFHLACVAAGLMAVARLRNTDLKVAASAGAVACGFVPWLTTALTSALLVLVLPMALVARHLGWRVRGLVVWVAVGAIAVIACTVAIAATYDGRGPVDWLVAQTLSGNRGLLWAEAFDAAVANPVEGVGTSRFSQVSATAADDLDLRWAHNEFLQIAAETGLPGFALSLALLLWVFTRFWAGGRDAATGVAAAGLAAMVVAASIDYVWHFPAVTLATAAIAGAGGAPIRGAGARGRGARTGIGHVDDRVFRDRKARVDAAGAGDAVWPRQLGDGHHQDPQVERE